MDTKVRKALEERLDALLEQWALRPLLMDDDDRAEIELLTQVLTLNRLDRIAYHLENGQIAIINS